MNTKTMQWGKRAIAMLLALMLLTWSVPAAAIAEAVDGSSSTTTEQVEGESSSSGSENSQDQATDEDEPADDEGEPADDEVELADDEGVPVAGEPEPADDETVADEPEPADDESVAGEDEPTEGDQPAAGEDEAVDEGEEADADDEKAAEEPEPKAEDKAEEKKLTSQDDKNLKPQADAITSWDTLKAALESGESVTLEGNIEATADSKPIIIKKDTAVTINLGGFTIDASKVAAPAITAGKNITLNGTSKVTASVKLTNGAKIVPGSAMNAGTKFTVSTDATTFPVTITDGYSKVMKEIGPTTNFALSEADAAKYEIQWNDAGTEVVIAEKATTVTVSYNANGGEGTMKSQEATSGEDVTLTSNAFTRQYYNFVNWNVAADGSGAKFANGETVKDLTEDLKLYAQWKLIEYSTALKVDDTEKGEGTVTLTNPDDAEDAYQVAVSTEAKTLSKKTKTAPTCTEGGVDTWTAKFTFDNGETYTVSTDVETKALGHDWGEATYTWSSDNKKCTAKRVCKRCKETEEKTVESTYAVTKAATTTATGTGTYTAKFEDPFKTQTKTVTIPKKAAASKAATKSAASGKGSAKTGDENNVLVIGGVVLAAALLAAVAIVVRRRQNN